MRLLRNSQRLLYQSNFNNERVCKRAMSVQVATKIIDKDVTKRSESESYEKALPFVKIPGPSKWSLLYSFMPGGKYYKKTLTDVFALARKEYGDILYFPGIFGKRDTLLTFDPVDFEKVFRADGQWPNRPGFDTLEYYRTKVRPDFYKKASGLGIAQGESWGRIRSIVNPVIMHPQTMKLYIPSVDKIATEFIQRIREIRDSTTNEVTSTFNDEIQYLAIENAAWLTMDTRLGLLSGLHRSEDAKNIVISTTDFFTLLYELEIKPSLWKVISTPKFRKMIKTQDALFEISSRYVEKAMERMKTEKFQSGLEKSFLEKLVEIDKDVAAVMVNEIIIGGIDTTSSAFTACLFELAKNQEKQNTLREELKAILPHKDTPLKKENMENLPYLRACIKEALRLNSVTVLNFRKTGQDIVLSGYQVPKDTNVSMVVHLIQRDEAHFPKAHKFIPERWLRNQPQVTECPSARTANPFVYLPFGFGPRMCIGKRVVNIMLEVALARIIRNFHVEHNHPDLVFKTTVINNATGDFRFKFMDVSN